ncbi:hypothetical protein DPMN_184782 [Dreissena polymorpha]|uniref:Uncharacterized protein n=1 Tax=Dreissena polymorpha TaxID=45954 RepID=A0A9D4DLI8_DREPO|nr:hypothetical protein DPMN_184782 [Dreissena polymorpha]
MSRLLFLLRESMHVPRENGKLTHIPLVSDRLTVHVRGVIHQQSKFALIPGFLHMFDQFPALVRDRFRKLLKHEVVCALQLLPLLSHTFAVLKISELCHNVPRFTGNRMAR